MHLFEMNSWFLVRVCPLKIFKNSIKTVLESSVLKSVLMLMIQILLVALAEIAEFNVSFIAVINTFSIYCHRNTLKQHAGKTVDEFYLRWNNKKTIFRIITIVTNNARQTICRNVILVHVIYGGILNHDSVTSIDKIYSSDPLKRGDYWRQTLDAMTPYCLGI